MKKNKLTFVIAATCLVLGTLVGCNEPAPVQNSSKNDATSIDGGSEVIGSSDNSNNSQGGGNTSQGGGNTSQGGGNTSQGGGNTSQGGGDQPGKTDWSDAEKDVMKEYLHGYVLPFVNMDVSLTTSQSSGTIKMQSQQNMADGFLASYAAKFTGDSEWDGGDISSEYGVYPGNAYAFKRKVAQNGKNYYIAVMFTGLQFTPGQEEPAISKDGCFYLEAMDPYIYEYPAAFISQWMGQVYSSTVVPPAFQAEYYGMEEEGVLIGYSETNIEGTYKTALESSGNFTIDPNKNAEGYYVARPSDSKYVLLFKYDVTQKLMIIKVEAPKGWNVAAINAIFRQYNTTPFALPVIEDPNIGFSASAQEYGGKAFMYINVTKVNTQSVQAFVTGLKTLGYKVAYDTVDENETQWATVANVYTDVGMYTIYVNYFNQGSEKTLTIYFDLDANVDVWKSWPAASIARYLEGATSTVPAFAGTAYGYSYTITNEYSYVVVHVDEGSESAARDSYIATLTSAENGYVTAGYLAGQPAFKSPDGHILVAISCNPTTFPGQIEILFQYIAVVDTPWPAEEVASGIANLFSIDPITDSVPALDVSDADDCYVNDNYGGEKIEICIDGLAASEGDFINDFKLAGWTEDPYYGFDTTSGAYGALISPNKQLVAYFDTYSNDLSIYVKSFFEPFTYTWPANDLNTILAKWGVSKDTLPAFEKAFVEVQEDSSKEELTIFVSVADSLKQRFITDYCIALESAAYGYHFDENRGGHISDNHELLIKFESDANGVKIIISNITMVYRVVGYNGNWTPAEGLVMVDATNPDENYEVQYMASFHVDADAKFKVVDSDNVWYGEDNASYRSSAFGEDSDDNITVNAAGTVTVYFKIYEDGSKDMWLDFSADPVVLAPWPSDEIDAILEGWSVTDEIPDIQDLSITDIQCAVLSEKSFAITVYGGSSFLGDYNDILEESYTFDNDKLKYVSESGKLLISTHNSGNDLIITVILADEEPELLPWPADDINGYLEAWGVYDSIPEIQDEAITDIAVAPDGESHFIIRLVDGGVLKTTYQSILGDTFDYDDIKGLWISISGDIGIDLSVDGDDLVIDVEKQDNSVQSPVYKLVGFFSDWNYDDDDSDELFEYDPEEGYLAQYSIYFEVKAGDEFKIYDGSGDSGWVGGEALQANQYSKWFEVLDGGNFRAKQDGEVDLSFDILSDGTKVITINDFIPQFEDGSWAKAQYEALQYSPDAEIPNLEIEGASGYVFNDGNGSIDISFPEGADLTNVPAALDAKLTAAGFHYSARFDGYVNVNTNTIIGVGFNDDMTISLYPGEYDFTGDSGYGLVVFSYDDVDDYYYDDGEEIGELNASNEYVLTYYFDEGTWFIIYDFGEETKFEVTVDEYSGVVAGDFTDYFEYDMDNNMFRVKQSFEGTIYIKLSYGNDQIYVAIVNPNP